MTEVVLGANGTTADLEEPLVVVTSDSHVSAPLEAYRPYCPARYQQDFDGFVEQAASIRSLVEELLAKSDPPEVREDRMWNLKTDGHFDIQARLRDMDHDGVAAEVIFHGSPPFDPIPFTPIGVGAAIENFELSAAGQQIYNHWLADFCSVEPERHVGLAYLPMWDIEASIKELQGARALGLRGVNLPAPRKELTPYEDPAWDPFWSACEDLEMALANHGGGGVTAAPATGPSARHIYTMETIAVSRISPVCRLVYGGVFERHPRLKLVQTEQPGYWYRQVLDDLDSQYIAFREQFAGRLPKLPSEYCRSNYFIGASFQSRLEAEGAIQDGFVGNMLWGSDYPHPEGTYRYSTASDDPPATHLSMRSTYAGLPPDAAQAMLGLNALGVYGLESDKLAAVAARINAPTLKQLSEPLHERPTHWTLAFREAGAFN